MASPHPDAAIGKPSSVGSAWPNDASLADAVGGWLAEARWFAAKGGHAGPIAIEECAAISSGPPGFAVAIVSVAGDERAGEGTTADAKSAANPQRYVLPLTIASGGTASDAACDPAFADWLVAMTLGGGRLRGRAGEFRGHRVAGAGARGRSGGGLPEVTPVGGDASNTSFIVRPAGAGQLIAAGPMVVKLIRRSRPGIQPEVEIGELLATEPGWRSSPRLLGWLEYVADASPEATGRDAVRSASTAIATVHELVPGCTSLWDLLVGLLSAGGMAGDAALPILRLAADLGRTTAELHGALAAHTDLPDFAPEPGAAATLRATAERVADHARRVFATATDRLSKLAKPVAARLAAVVAVSHRLVARLESSADSGSTAAAIRVHGDYHLGQVLFSTVANTGTSTGAGPAGQGGADGRLFVIDFEGEPARPLAERRAKASVFKDLAGMCRSFDYLVRHVARTTGRAPGPDDLRRLEAAFLEAYAAAAAGRPWWPADAAEQKRLLDIHRLDKAIYELAYELANRPDWVEVPLGALEGMAVEPAS